MMRKKVHTATATTPKRAAATIGAQLRLLAKPAVAKQGQAFFKDPVRLIGVTAPMMRKVAKALFAQVKATWRCPHALALCWWLVPRRPLEEKAVALLVLGRFANQFSPDLLDHVHYWIDRGWLASWGEIDCLCAEVLGPLVRRYPDLLRQTRPWTASPNRWLRRAAAVALVKSARHGELLDEAYQVAQRLMSDRDDLVQKATGWMLREAGRTDRARLEKFLLRHGPKVARTTLRYAIEHFAPEERARLLAATRR